MKLLCVPASMILALAPQFLFAWSEDASRTAGSELVRIAQLQGDSHRDALSRLKAAYPHDGGLPNNAAHGWARGG